MGSTRARASACEQKRVSPSNYRTARVLLEAADAICTEHEVGSAPDAVADDVELALERGLRFAPGVALRRYGFAVPELEWSDGAVPAVQYAAWLAVRDREDAVGWRELSPAAAAFVDHALQGATLAASMQATLGTAGASAAAVQDELAKLLTDLAADGALLGGAG